MHSPAFPDLLPAGRSLFSGMAFFLDEASAASDSGMDVESDQNIILEHYQMSSMTLPDVLIEVNQRGTTPVFIRYHDPSSLVTVLQGLHDRFPPLSQSPAVQWWQ